MEVTLIEDRNRGVSDLEMHGIKRRPSVILKKTAVKNVTIPKLSKVSKLQEEVLDGLNRVEERCVGEDEKKTSMSMKLEKGAFDGKSGGRVDGNAVVKSGARYVRARSSRPSFSKGGKRARSSGRIHKKAGKKTCKS